MEYNAEVTKIDIYLCLVFSRAPRTSPRKNISSIMGTVSEAAITLEKAGQLIAPAGEKLATRARSRRSKARELPKKQIQSVSRAASADSLRAANRSGCEYSVIE